MGPTKLTSWNGYRPHRITHLIWNVCNSARKTSFTVRQTGDGYRDYEQFTYSSAPANSDTITINSKTYTFTNGAAADNGDTTVARTSTFSAADLGTIAFSTSGTISSNGTPFSNLPPVT